MTKEAAFAALYETHYRQVRALCRQLLGTAERADDAAHETINDTLIAAGQTVAIDGTVNGDLFAFGRSVTIRGNVTGNVIACAETVTIEGTVGGDIVGAGRGVSLHGTHVGRNFFGFGRD